MSKTFTYTKITSRYYCDHSDEYEEDGVEFEYEVSDKRLLRELVSLICEDCFDGRDDAKEGIEHLIRDFGLIDEFADSYEDALKEIFEQEALDSYDD